MKFFISQDTHIILNHCVLLVPAFWLVEELAFSRVQLAALAIHALKDIPLTPLIFTSLALPLLESPTFSIIMHVIGFDQEDISVKKTFFSMVDLKYIHL